jgi:AcrR family transcriptional regulator
VLDVALALLQERGMSGLTMSALAARAGMSRATLYHYFPDVDAVLAAWVGEEIERSVSALLEEARALADPVERLVHLVEAQVRTFASQGHRLSAEHFESEAGSPAVRREVEIGMAPMRDLLATTIREAGEAGRLHTPIEPALGGDLLLGMLGAVRRRLVAGSLEPDEAVGAVMDLLRNGWLDLPPRPAGPERTATPTEPARRVRRRAARD